MSKTTRTGVSGLAALPAYSAASNTVVARKKHARIISIGALNAIQNSFINKLPIEILEQILIRVKVQDLFSLKKVCVSQSLSESKLIFRAWPFTLFRLAAIYIPNLTTIIFGIWSSPLMKFK